MPRTVSGVSDQTVESSNLAGFGSNHSSVSSNDMNELIHLR